MTDSANDNTQDTVQPEAAPQFFAGFSTRPGAPRAKTKEDEADTHVPPVNEDKRDDDKKSDLGKDFGNTEFMRLLCMVYGISEVPTAVVPVLKTFELDSSKAKPENSDGTLYAVVGGAKLEITKDSILTDDTITPALAYKMAAAASVNPAYKTLNLSGSLEDRVMLFLAAQHFGMEIEESSIPEVPEDQLAALAAKFHAFEKSANLPKSVAAEYLGAKDKNKMDWADEAAPSPDQPKQPKQKPYDRVEPQFGPAVA